MIDLALYIAEIARCVLGEPNPRLSTRTQLRFGRNGSIAVEISGPRRGSWFDHENNEGGGPADLIHIKGGVTNGGLAHWLSSELGIEVARGKSSGGSNIVARYPYRDEGGTLLFEVVRLDPKDFRQRRPNGNGGWIWETKTVRKVVYRLPELLATPLDQWIFVVEGEKDCDNLAWRGLIATTNSGGATNVVPGKGVKSKWRPEYNQFFQDRRVCILPDNDECGRAHAAEVARNLAPLAADLRVGNLNSIAEKGDVSDWLAAGGTPEALLRIAENSPLFSAVPADGTSQEAECVKPTITVVAGKRHLAANSGLQALADAGVSLYQRDRKICRVALIKAKNTGGELFELPGMMPVTLAILERYLAETADWRHFDKRAKREVPIDPPRPVVQQILDMVGQWPFPPLNGIILSPTLRRNGTLVSANGYDDATGLVLVNSLVMSRIPDNPTRDDAKAALALLTELLAEFPFVDEASRSVALSMMLTPVLRGAMEVAPMHLVTAPRPGTGKSYLADVASMIATGERCAVKAASPQPEETEKRLVAAALAGNPIIALDNCRDILQGDFLCQITERPLMELRALGRSDLHRIPNAFTCFANGNNVQVADDMVRRTIRSGLDANCESPETRSFKSNPLALIRADRGKYIAACLTIARAYLSDGRPGRLTPLPSYDGWSAIVRDALVWLGCSDPVSTMETLRNEDPKSAERYAVFEAWKSAIGVGKTRASRTPEIIDKAAHHNELREALLAVAAQRFGGEIDPKALGKWLSTQEKNISARCKLIADRTDKTRPKWYLELVSN